MMTPEWAITLTQPWATLVAVGEKRVETRAWGTHRRGAIAIHAAKGFPDDARSICYDEPFRSTLLRHGYENAAQLPTAAIVAVTDLARCELFKPDSEAIIRAYSDDGRMPAHEADFGDFTAGRYGLLTRNTIKLPHPIVARGMLGFWRIPEPVRLMLEHALAAAA
jgi:hypothetical protein